MGNKGDRKGDTTNEHRGGRELELELLAVDRAQGLRECEISLGSNWNDKKRKKHFINLLITRVRVILLTAERS